MTTYAGMLMAFIDNPLQALGIPLITEYGYLAIRGGGLSGKADNSWERGEFIVEVSFPGPTHTLPEHPLIHYEAQATRLNWWSGEVGGQST